jgi:hypothetical protein
MSAAIRESDKAHLFGRSRRQYPECLLDAYAKIGNTIQLLYEKGEEVA